MLQSNRVIRDEADHRGLFEISPCGRTAMRVQEDSLEPELKTGQLLGVAFGRLFLPGDVVVSLDESEGALRVNRLLGYRRMRGRWVAMAAADNSKAVDTNVPLNRVIGRISYADLTITAMDRFRAARRFLRTSISAASAKILRVG